MNWEINYFFDDSNNIYIQYKIIIQYFILFFNSLLFYIEYGFSAFA